MKNLHTIQLLDTHAGGDVSRIVTGGIDALPGATVRQQMEYLRDDADGRMLLRARSCRPSVGLEGQCRPRGQANQHRDACGDNKYTDEAIATPLLIL